jgi:eukaryotic-like serine/threonine-protein kinase
MTEPGKQSSERKCARCGAELPAGSRQEVCPKCLLQAGLETEPERGPGGTVVVPGPELKSRGLPKPGELFGHYRIVRVLGSGGMGAAFEADDVDSGRRVALKVLSQKLDSPEARERFLREGRLAASINHPNSVYVFGTEELAGTPVIAMELVAGGTLQERVTARGPLPIPEAVDAVLQIIAGLEAAQRIGILHRDVKPSNCFRDADGTVKIGDFGLSISTAVRTEPALTSAGAFLGTPAFCSPEQLRGDELNARSDMYSVGATLFYLLTGRTPFEGRNHVQLLATVLEQRAPSPRKFRPDIPQGLAKVILRCLEKQPGERFANYLKLAKALAPYGSAAPTPATMGLRFLAGVIDMAIVNTASSMLFLLALGSGLDFEDILAMQSPKAFSVFALSLVFLISYYALFEWRRGATPGKALCRLRVAGPDKSPPRFGAALARAAIYVLAPLLPFWLFFGPNPTGYFSAPQTMQYLLSTSYFMVIALLFVTARRRNGFAGVHDLLTKTRVVSRAAFQMRPTLATIETPPADAQGMPRLGPYHVLETLDSKAEPEWLLGYDLRLLRKVWLRKVPAGTPPISPALRNIGRPGRLRWLTGRRSPEENWDAFEAATGQPLTALMKTPQSWSQVRYWLHDLAQELAAAEKEGTLPELAFDRVWITSDGRAKLLDFPAPGATSDSSDLEKSADQNAAPSMEPVRGFLVQVAHRALNGGAVAPIVDPASHPLPLHARDFLEKLPQLGGPDAVAQALRPLLSRVTVVSRARRAAIVAGCLAFPLFAAGSVFFGTMFLEGWSAKNPGVFELSTVLRVRSAMNSRWIPADRPRLNDEDFAVYIAHRYRSAITNETVWLSMFAMAMIKGEARQFAEQSVAEHPAPSAEEIARAEAALKLHVPQEAAIRLPTMPWFPFAVVIAALAMHVAIPALVAALLFRGGLVLWIAGVTFVRRDGRRASRLRMFWRALATWSAPVAALFVMGLLSNPLGMLSAALIASGLLLAGALLSLAIPRRGLQDYLAGTWPVPR